MGVGKGGKMRGGGVGKGGEEEGERGEGREEEMND